MRKHVILSVLLALGAIMMVGIPSAVAQDDDSRTKFYDFDDMLIDGQFKKPDIMKQKAREKAEFQRLLNLKKPLLPEIVKTSEERALE